MSLREALDRAADDEGAREGRGRRCEEEARGVLLEAENNWWEGDRRLEMWDGRLGVLKFEMSLKIEAGGGLKGEGDGQCSSCPSIAA